MVTFGNDRQEKTDPVGVRINLNLSFQNHINIRTGKAGKLAKVLVRLGNRIRGMSPKALRAVFTRVIRPIFT